MTCMFVGDSGKCKQSATLRGRYAVPDKPIARCAEHTGHLLFTERLIGGEWLRWTNDEQELACFIRLGMARLYSGETLFEEIPF